MADFSRGSCELLPVQRWLLLLLSAFNGLILGVQNRDDLFPVAPALPPPAGNDTPELRRISRTMSPHAWGNTLKLLCN